MAALIIVQARMGSTRFPGKSLAEIAGLPILWYLFRQLSFCRHQVTSILATTDQAEDDKLAAYGESQGWNIFRGSADDVLGRYHAAAVAHGAVAETVIVRITGDSIFPDPHLIDAALELHAAFAGRIDCVFTADDDRLPYGVYMDSFVFSALERAHKKAKDAYDREHVSPYIKRNRDLFPRIEIAPGQPFPAPPLSIDTPEDLERTAALLDGMAAFTKPPFHVSDILKAAGRSAELAPPVNIGPTVSSKN